MKERYKLEIEMIKSIPMRPEMDDIFTSMGRLFLDTYREIIRMVEILEIPTGNHEGLGLSESGKEALMTRYMEIVKEHIDSRKESIENMPMQFLEIVREYQELLFALPEEPEEIDQSEIDAECQALHPDISHEEFYKRWQEGIKRRAEWR